MPVRICVALLLVASVWCGEAEAETRPLVHLTFDDPAATGFVDVGVTDGHTVTVAGGSARLVKSNRQADGCPRARVDLGQRDKGILRVAWTVTPERYEAGPRRPDAEMLFTGRILDQGAQMVFFVGCLGTKDADGGPLVASGADGHIGRWQAGKALRIEIAYDLGSNQVSVDVDGKQVVSGLASKRSRPLNYLQFSDGSGLGAQDGAFAASIDEVVAAQVVVPDPMGTVWRTTPPAANPAPQREAPRPVTRTWTVPGEVVTSWVGNTFGGEHHQNGFGRWVQNGIAPAAFAVSPDGTAVAGLDWDEAGRCIGLYKDGTVNGRLVAQYDMRGGHGAWGFGSSNHAVAVDGGWIYAGNNDGHLMRFRWTPGDLESHSWEGQLELGKEWVPRTLSARAGQLAALFDNGRIQIWSSDAAGLTALHSWKAPAGTKALQLAADGRCWLVGSDAVTCHRADDGRAIAGHVVTGLGAPTAATVSPDGTTLVICDNGPDQQVKLYRVDGRSAPKALRTVGLKGGQRGGPQPAGVPSPDRLYGLMGAGLDAKGNLLVGCSLHPSSRGTSIRAYDPAGKLLWDLQCHAFTDGYTFDPQGDGSEVVGADELISLDLAKPPGQEWRLKALTLDPLRYPKDPRLQSGHNACSGLVRTVGGRRLLYTIGMYSGGYNFFVFEPGGHLAKPVGGISERGTWAWSVDATGDIWCGDGEGKIRRHRFQRWDGDVPVFASGPTDAWPTPPGLRQICRTHYDPANDVMYLGAFPDGVPDPAWGQVGSVVERYDGWTKGPQAKRWRCELPKDDGGVYPKSMAIAGEYGFVVSVKPVQGVTGLVRVISLATGAEAGTIAPGAPVGYLSGWVDISHALAAHRRSDGEYLILVEEDFRGKNILYRWRPK